VYSFGATLYHVVAGRPPFGDDSPSAYLARLIQGERPPSAAPRDPELSGIIERAMAPRSEDRFTAAELLRALKEYLHGDLVFSHRYSWTGRAGRWLRKHRGPVLLTLAIAALAAALTVAWFVVEQRTERAARLAAEERGRAAAQVAAAEGRAAAEARRSAQAERDRSHALDTASRKDAEARQAVEEAERADKTSQTYRQLQGIAERKRLEADEARQTADFMAEAAERRAADAHAAAEEAQADAEATRRRAEEVVIAMSRERDDAVALQARAEMERDRARALQSVAEAEREQMRAAVIQAQAERDALRRGRDGSRGRPDAGL
jgi:hypothetical protein